MVPKTPFSRLISIMKCMSEVSTCAPGLPTQLFWQPLLDEKPQKADTNHKEPMLKLSLGICVSDDVTVIYCKGRIVYRDEAAAFSAAVARLLDFPRQLVLDFSEVEAIDGTGLGELATLLMKAKAAGGSVRIAALSRPVRELLEVTNLVSAFEIHSSVDDAILSARGQVA
jgi:anti-anti-sigma factor